MTQSWQADLALLGVALVWGATFVMVKEAVAKFPVFAFLALRFAIAFVALLPFVGLRLRHSPGSARGLAGWPELRAGGLMGLALALGYALQTTGLRYTTAAKAGFITGLSVILVPLLTVLLRHRPLPATAGAGVVLAALGLAFLSLNADLSAAWGDCIVLGCALAFALHILAVGAYAPRMDPWRLTATQLTTVALVSGLLSLVGERPWPVLSRQVLFAALFTGVWATSVAFAVQTIAQRFTSSTHTALIFSMEPVFAALFAYLWGGEVLGPWRWLGCGLILAGMLLAEVGQTAQVASRRWAWRLMHWTMGTARPGECEPAPGETSQSGHCFLSFR